MGEGGHFLSGYQKRARGAYIVEVLYKLTEDVHVEGDLLLELQCRL